MKIYDISQEIFTCAVYPGDALPVKSIASNIDSGDLYNLTNFSMCAHNGTHIDAPFHFIANGKTVEKIPLEKTIGYCSVITCYGDIDAKSALEILRKTADHHDAKNRILLKGEINITSEAAKCFADSNIYLIGVESQSVGNDKCTMELHKILLEKEIVLLEGIRLENIHDGIYFLNAAPLPLGGCEGAPCRAILVDLQ